MNHDNEINSSESLVKGDNKDDIIEHKQKDYQKDGDSALPGKPGFPTTVSYLLVDPQFFTEMKYL